MKTWEIYEVHGGFILLTVSGKADALGALSDKGACCRFDSASDRYPVPVCSARSRNPQIMKNGKNIVGNKAQSSCW